MNLEHLFDLCRDNQCTYTRSNATERSIFNLKNLRELLFYAGNKEKLPNIIEDKTAKLDLSILSELTERLELLDNRRTYILIRWLENAVRKYYLMEDTGGFI